MCVIAICTKNRIQKDYFDEAFKCNDDGVGISWRENNNLRFVKGLMKIDEAWTAYNTNIHTNNFPHIVHFRSGTPTTEDLTHPFLITDTSEIFMNYEGSDSVLFHNGTVSGWKECVFPTFIALNHIPEGNFSDTRLIAILLKRLGRDIFKFLDGKWIIFGKNNMEIYGDWKKEEDGIIWSNLTYKPTKTYFNNKKLCNETTEEKETITEYDKLDYGSFGTIESIRKSIEFII